MSSSVAEEEHKDGAAAPAASDANQTTAMLLTNPARQCLDTLEAEKESSLACCFQQQLDQVLTSADVRAALLGRPRCGDQQHIRAEADRFSLRVVFCGIDIECRSEVEGRGWRWEGGGFMEKKRICMTYA